MNIRAIMVNFRKQLEFDYIYLMESTDELVRFLPLLLKGAMLEWRSETRLSQLGHRVWICHP